jgi:uncharacterized cupin superfamily protein
MAQISIQKLDLEALVKRDVFSWDVWEKEVSTFEYYYDEQESCYFTEGSATIADETGTVYFVTKGDFVVFPKGMRCVWNITEPVKKYFQFG